ncbi:MULTISPECIES: protein translocase subunit SecD [Streptomyces]|uniref:Multifunctional fusion protein n=1 Tax=Streptomyces tsukubensis (strain DSM 42081 / NBRC 108919 / NRRL 18488 / 9993) TaxID=1114943 RepID=I2NBL7_STRT9|nr:MULTISPECIES: protein translocase subunit SecD [Streptomyces]AZK98128.1 protein translocase subunit SecDF [Streptomyces tsukubensis]EIF94414.1 bifunctional preprotein translocase subunit SecD/SecF [Streptomyces tsukubensis NRRL18488]MYS63356.1 protein translocase subunit SecD [Streptomyces sp. SID5473]QKM65949.1 protein translocase subunit SecD [Streptomyces tsukubensis NRRL18488]TAI42235.1 protein translocase subunit SecD [Streptomyces tsukubensis]
MSSRTSPISRASRTSRAPRGNLWRALAAFAVVAVSLLIALTSAPRLGLDLRGGTRIVLETRDSPTVRADAAATDRTLEVLRQRVDALGVAEASLARSGDRRIVVELPGVDNPREAAAAIGRTAQLTFHPVRGATAGPAAAPAADGSRVLPDPDAPGSFLALAPPALTGNGVKDAEAVLDPASGRGWTVDLAFRGGGAKDWARITGQAACAAPGDPARRVAIVLDDRIVSAPGMERTVACGAGITGGSAQITGGFGGDEARELAALVKGGALPVPVTTLHQSTVGPTLGEDAIRASFWAAVIGLVCTGVFIVVVYRLLGLLATVALALYGLISYAAVVALGATLTLPGLAGFVLAIGIAVDANVLVFERAREEFPRGKRDAVDPRKPLRTGFRKAWSAVADSHVTTLLAAGLLFAFAVGPVKGFGVTLAIGVLASLVSAMVITRLFAEWILHRPWVRRRPGLTGIASKGRLRTRLEKRPPRLMRRRKLWLGLCGGLLLAAVVGIGVRGLEFGVEFTGGRQTEYVTGRTVDADTARQAVSDAGFPRAVVQESGEGGITVRTGELSDAEQSRISAALGEVADGARVERDERIGPSLGAELRTQALIALGVAVAAQLGYLALRFRWTFAVSAVAAMAQDVLLVVGLFAWLGKPVDSVFLAALLTVVGYSVNDSVVVLDRLRELRRSAPRAAWPDLADLAVAQTLPRTVNTGMGALFVLAALAVLGGDSLADFSVALLAGVVAGVASTVFTAMPLAVILTSGRRDRPRREPVRSARDRNPSGAVV